MPSPQAKPQAAPDFIPVSADTPDFIPEESAQQSAAPTDQRNSMQKGYDEFEGGTPEETGMSRWSPEGMKMRVLQGAGDTIAPLMHPIKTFQAAEHEKPSLPSMILGPGYDMAKGLIHSFGEDPVRATGQMGAGIAEGEAGGMAMRGLGKLGGSVERGGLELGNDAMGAKGPKPFKYGADPARGAYEGGVLPAMSKHSASMKLEDALPETGKNIANAVNSSGSTIPAPRIANSIETPIIKTGDAMSGFGGGKPLDPITDLWSSMEGKAPNASGPIYGPHAPVDVSPTDLWQSIRNLDKNTRFNPDPEVEGVNELRRDIRGALRGDLEDAVPGLKPMSRQYGDLMSAQETMDRTMHSGRGIRKALDMLTFPLESTTGRAMYEAGKAARTAAPTMAAPLELAAPAIAAKKKEKEQ